MVFFGNLLTHYNYRLAKVDFHEDAGQLEIRIQTSDHEADLHVLAALNSRPAAPPPGLHGRRSRWLARAPAGAWPITPYALVLLTRWA